MDGGCGFFYVLRFGRFHHAQGAGRAGQGALLAAAAQGGKSNVKRSFKFVPGHGNARLRKVKCIVVSDGAGQCAGQAADAFAGINYHFFGHLITFAKYVFNKEFASGSK
jgi:hypothetical protein